ncbi:hypothetical protein L243_07805 [Salmonella enterica subsp. enterica serovar Worthington str. BCH-3008]|nr:hypothetical protein L243_07805 [Salmonella enterica subsp. enterica serovar Worthington str. BCH-3008]
MNNANAEYWIDVRIPEQYQREHIQGAINIPLILRHKAAWL